MQKASIFAGVKLTNNEPLCVGELLEEFPKVLIALLVCRAQHLQRQTQSDTHARTRARAHPCTHQHALHALCLAPPPSGLFASMKMRVNLVKSSQRWDVASRHCVADFDRMDVKWTASRATAREATAPAIADGWITHGLPMTHASALRSLLDLQMKPFLKNKVKRMRRVEKRVTSGSRTDSSRLCESSHCPRQMLFLQQEKLGGNVNGQYNNKDKRKSKSSSSGLVKKAACGLS